MKQIKVPLSINGLEELKQKLLTLQSGLGKASKDIAKELADVCEKEIASNYASSPYTDGNDDGKVFKAKTENGYKVGAEGSQVAYREFGTGTKGEQSPHPIKSKFNLRGYNSSLYPNGHIRVNSKNGELFWIYKDRNGNLIYTTGIPAGKEVFNASVILKGRKYSIIKKKVGGVISKL